MKFATTDDIESIPGAALLELLCTRRGCALSDPRDMIYAHLGLASATTRKTIVINYDKTVAQIFEEISCFFLEWMSVESLLDLVEKVQPE
jgi:hypothetical protein